MDDRQIDTAKVTEHRKHLESLETEHLTDLWNASSEKSWTPEGLEAIRQVLMERLGTIPQRRNAQPAPQSTDEADTYYDLDRMLSLSTNLNGLSWMMLAIACLAGIAFLLMFAAALTGLGDSRLGLVDIAYRASGAFPFLYTFLISISLTFVLRAIAEALLLLMDVEENSRHRMYSV